MKEISYSTKDKSGWGEGPWQNEPDKIQFEDPATKMPCLIVRNEVGALCGYVGVTSDHPAFEQHYDSQVLRGVEAHGGLTFSNFCQREETPAYGICHIPGKNEPHKIWWLGFDCAHLGDICPQMDAFMRELGREPLRYRDIFDDYGDTYKTVEYVREGCARLASQLHAITHPLLENTNEATD